MAKINKSSHHSLKRISERIGVTSERDACALIKNARMYGRGIGFYKEYPEFYDFLVSKSMYKVVKVYRGYIYILNKTHRTGTGCTTVYEIPEEYRDGVERYDTEHTGLYVKFYIGFPGHLKVCLPVSDNNIKKAFYEALTGAGLVDKYFLCEDGTIEHNHIRCGSWETFQKNLI